MHKLSDSTFKITNSGFSAGEADLTNQGYGARAKLQEAGNNILTQGRSTIGGIANTARQAAANYNLGSTFDPFSYSNDINGAVSNFFNGLGDKLRAAVPGDLYTTAGLGGIAGAAQGAGNTAFNPNALAGLFDNGTDKKDETTNALTAF